MQSLLPINLFCSINFLFKDSDFWIDWRNRDKLDWIMGSFETVTQYLYDILNSFSRKFNEHNWSIHLEMLHSATFVWFNPFPELSLKLLPCNILWMKYGISFSLFSYHQWNFICSNAKLKATWKNPEQITIKSFEFCLNFSAIHSMPKCICIEFHWRKMESSLWNEKCWIICQKLDECHSLDAKKCIMYLLYCKMNLRSCSYLVLMLWKIEQIN